MNVSMTRGAGLLASMVAGLAVAQPKEGIGDGWDRPTSSPLNQGIPSRLFSPSASGYPGWVLSGSTPDLYELARIGAPDPRCGATTLRSVQGKDPASFHGFGDLMQAFSAERYRGKRVRLSAQVQAVGVKGWAGLWVRVEGAERKASLAFDNMKERPLKGNVPCGREQVVVDVPTDASVISLGFLLHGQGSLFIGGIRFEVVGPTVPTTDLISSRPAPEGASLARTLE